MTRRFTFAVAALVAGCTPSDAHHPWRQRDFIEIESISAVPAPIREDLGVDEPGTHGVADKGQPFNATDVIHEPHPMRRFMVGGRSGDTWVIALEHGGIGYSIEAYLYADGRCSEFWNVNRAPSLSALLEQLDSKGSPCDG